MLDRAPGMTPEEITEVVSDIRKSGVKIMRLIGDFLTLSKIEAGHVQVNLLKADLKPLLDELMPEFELLAMQKGIEFKGEIAEGMPELAVDKKLLQRAVSNLLQNALAYTPKGGSVTLRAGCARCGPGEFIEVSVSDTGMGIPDADKDKVFDKYYRSPRTSGIKGSGLGLAIVKAVADTHGGKVELKSEEGRGSEFKVLLPVASNEMQV